MKDPETATTAPADVPDWQRSPLARILIFVVLLGIFQYLVNEVERAFGIDVKKAPPLLQLVMRALEPLLAYLLLVRLVERRPVAEMSLRTLLPQSLAGIVGGIALFSVVVCVLWLAGSYHVTGIDPQAHWLPALLVVGLGAGIGEELITRGVLFRLIEEGLGTWAALILSALFFGAMHIANPGATLWSSAAIAIEAGLLFGLLYHVTRSLWPCMGLHAAWNFAQGTIYGIPVSGTAADGWLVSTRTGPDWLSGGAFGAEASVVALALCSCCTVVLLVIALRRHTIVPPFWSRR